MKSFSFIALGTLAVMSACTSRPANQFDLRGNIEGADGQTIYLTYTVADSMVTDSTVIVDGKFAFIGTVDGAANSSLYTGTPLWESKTFLSVYLEPTEITVDSLTASDFSNATVSGSKTQVEVEGYNAMTKPIATRMTAIRQSMQTADEATRQTLQAEMDSLSSIYDSINLDFIKSNPESYYAADLLNHQAGRLSHDELKSLYDALLPEVQPHAKDVAKEIATLETLMPGKPAPDLIGINPEGKEIKLSDLKGKVVLIDFWATWCGPCRAALPHVKELYDKYHEKGFEVFCVGDNDSSADEWKEVIVKEGMEKYHNILRGLKVITDANGKFVKFDTTNDQSDKYAVHFLPTKYLIAADGSIIGKIDKNEELDAKLAEIFQ